MVATEQRPALKSLGIRAKHGDLSLEELAQRSYEAGSRACHETMTTRVVGVRMEDVERQTILSMLDVTGWDILKAAKLLGISKTNIYRKIRLYEKRHPEDVKHRFCPTCGQCLRRPKQRNSGVAE